MKNIFLGLGSNSGNRPEHLKAALKKLAATPGVKLKKLSSVYETEPVGFPDQPWFLNMTLEICTEMGPQQLLTVCKSVEQEIGREKTFRWGPRRIDIDILGYNEQIIHNDKLVIPHPRMEMRKFVLIPLAEVAPYYTHPRTGDSIDQLLKKCPDKSRVDFYASSEKMFDSTE